MADKTVTISASAGSGVVGLGIGLAGSDTDAAAKVLDAVLGLLTRIDPNVLMLEVFFAAVMVGCWLRTGHMTNNQRDIYGKLTEASVTRETLSGKLDRTLDALAACNAGLARLFEVALTGTDPRKESKPVANDKRRR